MTRSLTAPERETVITMNDEDDTVDVFTHQRPIYTKLMKNPAFELLEDLTWGRSVGGRFRGPANMISFRSRTRKTILTDAQRAQATERLRRHARAQLEVQKRIANPPAK